MIKKTAYETGARKLKTAVGPDPADDFSQDAAKNKLPPYGAGHGLSQSLDDTTEATKQSEQRGVDRVLPERQADDTDRKL